MKTSAKIALGGVTVALVVVSMLLTVVPVTVYALPALAGAFLIPLTIEAGIGAGLSAYAVAALLSLLLVPSVEPKILFLLFFGYYPVLRLKFQRLPAAWRWAAMVALFNVAIVASYALLLGVFHLDSDMFTVFGVNLPVVFWLLGNVAFAVYEVCLSRVTRLYQRRGSYLVRRLFR